MAPLMGREMHRTAVLVADLAGLQPAVQLCAVGAGIERDVAGDVGAFAREQQRCPVWPSLEDPALLLAGGGFELFVDGDGGFAFHLGVEVAQVGGTLPVVDDAAERERQRAGDPQAAPGEDQGDQLGGRVSPAVQVGW